MDGDLNYMDRNALIAEVKRLREGIRDHRDSSGHDLCWFHPKLWGLLPEPIVPDVAVPPWPKFMRGCIAYRTSLDRELADAPACDREFDEEQTELFRHQTYLPPGRYTHVAPSDEDELRNALRRPPGCEIGDCLTGDADQPEAQTDAHGPGQRPV